MQRVKRATAVAVLPADPVGGTPGYFSAPDPGGGISATVPGYEWYNGVQEELCAVIAAAGIALDSSDLSQLLKSIVKLGAGRLINVQIFSASGTYTPTTGVTSAVVEVVGGGGGGGSSGATSAGQIAAAAGGGAGGYARKRILAPASQAVTIGTAGAAGTGGSVGGPGGTSSFGALVSATGGSGGIQGGAGGLGNGGGALGGMGSGGNINIRGQSSSGPWGIASYPIVRSGAGGSGIYGAGGDSATTFATGNNGSGYGAGGGGGACPPSSGGAASGGTGTAGLVIVWEYA